MTMTLQNDLPVVYSIGHSNHDLDAFIDLLQPYGIDTLVDVRSHPYSRWVPAFNREVLSRALEEAGLTYLFMGDALGGRPADPSFYDPGQAEGRPNYDRVAEAPGFRAAIEELLALARTGVVAMMCSEGDHQNCHRALLITPSLLALGARVIHIQPDGRAVEARPEPKQLSLF
jgi:uncharacterized protein (DUF488 family)